jgi:hypothetical protein
MKKIKQVEFKHDKNGNKVVLLRFEMSDRAFSIQTLGNLPLTHFMSHNDIGRSELIIITHEVKMYLRVHGTDKQKIAAGIRIF